MLVLWWYGPVWTARRRRRVLGGWDRARWGMTVQEVLAAFAKEAMPVPEGPVGVEIPSLALGECRVRVRFLFNRGPSEKDRGLEQVTLTVTDFGRGAHLAHTWLHRMLTQRYGTPAATGGQTELGVAEKEATWAFPDGTITLRGMWADPHGEALIDIVYRRREQPTPVRL